MAYPRIEDHGLIGNMNTAALVAVDGTIDWLCLPQFDSPSVFASILDHEKGGHFRIGPADPDAEGKQFYWPDTNVLVTRFVTREGAGQVTDYMPVGIPPGDPGCRWLVREVRGVRGSLTFRMECRPGFNYARDPHEMVLFDGGVHFRSPSFGLTLASGVPLEKRGGAAVAEFALHENESVPFVLKQRDDRKARDPAALVNEVEPLFRRTVDYWHRWIGKCTYRGRWREIVHRAALVLKLLTCEQTGAIVASPTTGLPEEIGGVRNWDYRYTWIRDAAFTLYALLRIGFTEEAMRFMGWVDRRCHEKRWDGALQVMYRIDGSADLEEQVLDHLEGHRGSRPVRIGNAAHRHLQLDIYGELLDAAYLYNKYGAPISYDLWTHLRRLLDWVCENWGREDEGIWEVRGPRRHFVHSKLMCWVALDRGLRLADKRSFPADRERWRAERDRIYEAIMERGWNEKLGAFVQTFDGKELDSAVLMMPLVLFVAPSDPRMLRTLEAILRPPREGGLVSNGLVYRYDRSRTDDGLPGREGTFNLCSFWLVEALTRAGRENPPYLERARLLFEEMLGYANHLGLYSEQTGPTGEALGNFPLALTHLSLISAAFNLDRVLDERPS